jgi:hypothetical protein
MQEASKLINAGPIDPPPSAAQSFHNTGEEAPLSCAAVCCRARSFLPSSFLACDQAPNPPPPSATHTANARHIYVHCAPCHAVHPPAPAPSFAQPHKPAPACLTWLGSSYHPDAHNAQPTNHPLPTPYRHTQRTMAAISLDAIYDIDLALTTTGKWHTLVWSGCCLPLPPLPPPPPAELTS